jgi:hypothetical protein
MRGCPRHIDTSHHFCPNADCSYYGWVDLGNLSATGHPSGGPWHQLYCSQCEGYFLETQDTSALKDYTISEDEAIARLSRSPHWVWTAMKPESKLLLAIDVGERNLAMAQRVVHHQELTTL